MSEQAAHEFIEALQVLERDSDPQPLVDRYAGDCEVGNLTATSTFRGEDGARRFWLGHRELFADVQSEFHNVIVDDGRAALEWTISGHAQDGAEVRFSGVTLLEYRDNLIIRSMAYFDPHQLGRQLL
ncbi:MAG: nuclear transport factor 2 family protein [Actinomycetota bacterium]|nr:nuclear transport factor 2 family protein [Actinomycetota bacterium]